VRPRRVRGCLVRQRRMAGLLLAVMATACAPGITGERGQGGVTTPTSASVAPLTQTATPATAATATPTPRLAPTATTTPTAAAAPGAGCRSLPTRAFGKIYSENPNVARAVGCPTEPEKAVYSAEQFFQKGYMFWRSDTRQIYVIMNSGRWAVYPDNWQEGEPLPTVTATPPAGLVEPERGFGKVWHARLDVRDALGWATGRERGFDGIVQSFERGTMLWSDGRFIFVLVADGTWLRFEDTFKG
ncbi:MAG: hypothetical protein Q8P59_12650, partial [Dehalococcoidia bacterium]|nr:hypothetical protein [Dehalococcoidia bacterium]